MFYNFYVYIIVNRTEKNRTKSFLPWPLLRLEGVLKDLESRNGITQRWTTECEEYHLARDTYNDRSKKLALAKLHTKVIERWFLLSLKAKYAGRSMFVCKITFILCISSLSFPLPELADGSDSDT